MGSGADARWLARASACRPRSAAGVSPHRVMTECRDGVVIAVYERVERRGAIGHSVRFRSAEAVNWSDVTTNRTAACRRAATMLCCTRSVVTSPTGSSSRRRIGSIREEVEGRVVHKERVVSTDANKDGFARRRARADEFHRLRLIRCGRHAAARSGNL